jgi:membrane protease YdiL (CAAX protease family)
MSRASTLLRVALFWTAYLVILMLASIPKGMVPPAWGSFVWGIVAVPLLLALTHFLSSTTAPPLARVGLVPTRASVGRLATGLVIGAATYSLTLLAISLLVVPLHYVRSATPDAASLMLVVLTTGLLAAMEEVGFRGYSLQALLRVLPTWQAQLLVAVAFGATHLAFGWPWQSVVTGVIPSALLFGAVAQWSGGLAMPIGVHAAVNLARIASGESGSPGIWQLVVDDASASALAARAPLVGTTMTLLAVAAVWGWSLRSRGRGVYLSGTSPES